MDSLYVLVSIGLLLWLVCGLIGYSLLAFKDVTDMLCELDSSHYLDSHDLPYNKATLLLGMFICLLLGPLTIVWFIFKI